MLKARIFQKEKNGIAKQTNAGQDFYVSLVKGLDKKKQLLFDRFLLVDKLINPRVVDAEELRQSGAHVTIIVLTLGTFAVKKLKNRVIRRFLLNQTIHHLK